MALGEFLLIQCADTLFTAVLSRLTVCNSAEVQYLVVPGRQVENWCRKHLL